MPHKALWIQLLFGKWGFPQIRGTLFGVPHNKDYNILGSELGFLNFGKLPSMVPHALAQVVYICSVSGVTATKISML